MKINSYGENSKFYLETTKNLPELKENQVLIRNFATSINPIDIASKLGLLESLVNWKLPITLGYDVAGQIEKVGKSITQFKKGDNVFGMMDQHSVSDNSGFAYPGSLSTHVVTRANTLALMPNNISHVEAASFPLVALTAYQALYHKTKATKGQHILINGASGGVGIMALQIAKVIGLKVTVVCGTEAQSAIKQFNPDRVINYLLNDFTEREEKFDIVFDVFGNKSFEECKKVLKKDGVYISNVPTEATFNAFYNPEKTKEYGFNERNMFNWVKPSGKDMQKISAMIENGSLQPVIEGVYSVEEVSEAFEFKTNNKVFGKVVLDIT